MTEPANVGVIFQDDQITIDHKTIRFKGQTVPASSLTSVEVPKKSTSGCVIASIGAVMLIATAGWGWRGTHLAESLLFCAAIVAWGLWHHQRSTTQTVSAQIGLQIIEVYRSNNAEAVASVHRALVAVISSKN